MKRCCCAEELQRKGERVNSGGVTGNLPLWEMAGMVVRGLDHPRSMESSGSEPMRDYVDVEKTVRACVDDRSRYEAGIVRVGQLCWEDRMD